jgi:hypothetical protein
MRHRRESNLVMIALAAIVAVSFLVVLALRFPPQPTAPYNTNTTNAHTRTPATTGNETLPTTSSSPAAKKAGSFKIVLRLSGPTWVEATIGSPSGPGVIAQGLDLGPPRGFTIDPAAYPTLTFTARKPVYLALGAPGNVTVVVNGHRVTLPYVAAGGRVRLAASGATAA